MSLAQLDESTRHGVESFIKKYNPELTVDNFHAKGILFSDALDQRVVVVNGDIREGYIHFPKGNADIFIITKGETMLGWVHVSSVIDAEDRFMMPIGSLNKMPKELKFAQECPHLAYFGGYSVGDGFMKCLGCGKEVVA